MYLHEKSLGRVGDVNPIEHGGGVVIETSPRKLWDMYGNFTMEGETSYRLEYTHGIEDDSEEETAEIQVYTVDLYLSAEEFHAWYDWVDWRAIAESCNWTKKELAGKKALATPIGRAMAIVAAANYIGWHEFATYTKTLEASKVAKDWELDK